MHTVCIELVLYHYTPFCVHIKSIESSCLLGRAVQSVVVLVLVPVPVPVVVVVVVVVVVNLCHGLFATLPARPLEDETQRSYGDKEEAQAESRKVRSSGG